MTDRPSSPGSAVAATIWFALAAAGLVGTWTFNVLFILRHPGEGYLAAWFANEASSSAAVDLLVVTLAACLLMLLEGARLGWSRWVWVLIPLSAAVAIAATFPLFLGLREAHRIRRARAAEAPAP